MIIEVIPFFHIMAADIVNRLGEENAHQIVATVMVAFALSSILTGMLFPLIIADCHCTCQPTSCPHAHGTIFIGLAFLVFGLLELGSVIGFFPRHILVGYVFVLAASHLHTKL